MEKSEWTRKWEEVRRQESEQQVARLAMDKTYRRYEWWGQQNETGEQEQEDG